MFAPILMQSKRRRRPPIDSSTLAIIHLTEGQHDMKIKRLMIGATGLSVPLLLGTATTASAESLNVAAGSPSAVSTSAVAVGYDISIHTANVNYAGTDGDVWLRVNGSNGSTPYLKLDDSADNYERNRTDRFLRSGVNVGMIRSVTIYFNPLGGAHAEWLPDRVTVEGITFHNSSWFQKGSPTYRTLTA